ncbi:MAG TPA: hypothetical protein VMW75_26785 [Thermoanaerobaculia bacterium]|nr:hypothetical protein [Thermoanaerobaculia bacterium]
MIADGFERESYRAAFLDLLYLFGMHLHQEATEKAVQVCRAALTQLDLLDLGHEQPWTSCQTVLAPPSSLFAISMIDSPSFFVKSWARSQESRSSPFPVTGFLAARASLPERFSEEVPRQELNGSPDQRWRS